MTEQEIITIRTAECDICNRYDSVMLSAQDVMQRTHNELDIGQYIIRHVDHKRVIYFDNVGKYLGDSIYVGTNNVIITREQSDPLIMGLCRGDLIPLIEAKEVPSEQIDDLIDMIKSQFNWEHVYEQVNDLIDIRIDRLKEMKI